MPSFGEILQGFKESESPETIIPLIDDSKLRSALVAWSSVKITYKTNAQCEDKDTLSKWEWLWNQIDYDFNTFAIVAGIQTHESSNIITRLKGLRLIYPDGTINSLAQKFLQGVIVSQLPKMKKAKSI